MFDLNLPSWIEIFRFKRIRKLVYFVGITKRDILIFEFNWKNLMNLTSTCRCTLINSTCWLLRSKNGQLKSEAGGQPDRFLHLPKSCLTFKQKHDFTQIFGVQKLEILLKGLVWIPPFSSHVYTKRLQNFKVRFLICFEFYLLFLND